MALMGVECKDCSFKHPVGVAVCPECGSDKIEEFESSGKGSIYTFTVSTFVAAGPFKDRAPYVIAVVETDEGMRMSTIVDMDEPTKAKVGDAVVFSTIEEGIGPVFKAA